MLDEKISHFFSEIEDLIKLQLQGEIQLDINQKFKEVKELIDELEVDNEEQYKFFKYKYHAEYSSYLKTVGDVVNASHQEKLAKRYEIFGKKYGEKPERTESIRFTKNTLDIIDKDLDPEKESIRNNVEEQLKNIQSTLEDNVIDSIRQAFQQFNEIPKTFDDYQKMIICETTLHNVVNNIISEWLVIHLPEKHQTSNNEQQLDSLNRLQSLASEAAYLKKVDFIRHVLNSSNKKKILFGNILFTEEEIKKRFKKLALYFHPDTNMLQDKHINLGNELFRIVLEFKESLLADLEKVSKDEGCLVFHEKNANKLWQTTIDYRNAAKGQRDKLKLLKEEDIRDFSSEELERFSVENGKLAYKEYRAACKIADNVKQLQKQVKLRGYMALCLYVSNQYLEAQLYALSAIQLLLRNSQKVRQQDLIEAKKIFDKVKGGDVSDETSKLSTEIKLENNPDNMMALVKIDQEISYYEQTTIRSSIKNDMAMIVTGLMLKADRSLIRYQAPTEEILHSKRRGKMYKALGGTVSVAGVIIGGSVIIEAMLFGPIGLIAGLFLGVWSGRRLWKEGSVISKEPEIREKLNNIMIKAISAYDKGKYQEFLEELSKDYRKDDSLLKLKKGDIIPKNIINVLLNHGFRSDGIAYLLGLIGEVLSSGKVKLEGETTNELKELAKNVFNGVLNEELEEEAKILDERIRDLRKGYVESTFNKIMDFVFLKEYSDIAKEYKDDAQEMPFQSRLEEMRNIARVNLAIFDIIEAGTEEIARAVETIKKIQDSINCNYQFVSAAESRIEALKDLLWIINGVESPEESPKLSLITFPEPIQDGDNYLHYLNEKLQHASEQEKLRLHNSIAAYYEELAEKEDKINRLKSLCYWQNAQKNYEKALEINHQDLDASLGFAKCLLKLSKHTQVIELCRTSSFLISSSEYWRFRSIAQCKQAKYKEANEYIIEALRLDCKNQLADKQRALLQKLSKENKINNRINRYKEKTNIKYNLKNSHDNENPVYNILSIDGGGIRGVLPALWLSEIEHRAHRPISHLFNMMAGTSTGGFIAAGLSAPRQLSSYNYSTSMPASNLLDFYQNQAKDIFSDFPFTFITSLMKTKYSDKGRLSLFEEYFHSTKLNQALTELVIPSVNEVNPTQAYLFTRYDALNDNSMNETFVNTLMATTAAPTFFPPYNIKDKGVFLDGGIHLNNPVTAAYNEAIRYNIAEKKISVLSLGTGSYVPEPLNPDQYRSQLFWAQNLHKAQQGNTDDQMYARLGNRYQRWQVWLEEPIGLDDYGSVSYLLEIGNQYIEELDASDENPINKLVDSFDDKVNLNSTSKSTISYSI